MAILNDFEHLQPTISHGEKGQILKWLVQDLGDDFPGIDTRPDVCGGCWSKRVDQAPRSSSCSKPIRPCVPKS